MQYKATTSVDLSVKYPSKLDEAPHYEKKAKDLAIDFLTSLRKHVVGTLSGKFGSQSSPTGMDHHRTRCLVTTSQRDYPCVCRSRRNGQRFDVTDDI
jgi:hypothetical protein